MTTYTFDHKTTVTTPDTVINKTVTVGGSMKLSLSEAIADSATLNVSVILGGLELRVPREWRIQSDVTPILGGVDGRSVNTAKPGVPTLVITGDVILGGIDIKQ